VKRERLVEGSFGVAVVREQPAAPRGQRQAGEARIKEVVLGAGFSSFRRVTETPFNMVFEAKP
jgi:hypothetical protein